ncbi:unnamed protein product [Musa textilis]
MTHKSTQALNWWASDTASTHVTAVGPLPAYVAFGVIRKQACCSLGCATPNTAAQLRHFLIVIVILMC